MLADIERRRIASAPHRRRSNWPDRQPMAFAQTPQEKAEYDHPSNGFYRGMFLGACLTAGVVGLVCFAYFTIMMH